MRRYNEPARLDSTMWEVYLLPSIYIKQNFNGRINSDEWLVPLWHGCQFSINNSYLAGHQRCKLRVMGYHNQCHRKFAIQLHQQAVNVFAVGFIQVAGGLIREQDQRL